MTLREAIEQLIGLGYHDPDAIVEQLRSRHGPEWLRDQAASAADVYARGCARELLGSRRRANQPSRAIALSPRDRFMLDGVWVPEVGWLRHSELTVADCRAVAAHRRMLAAVAGAQARFYDGLADLLEQQGVQRVGELTGDLPQLVLEAA